MSKDTRVFVCVLGFLGVALCCVMGRAQAQLPAQLHALMDFDEDQVWEGTITIKETGTAHDEYDHSDGEKVDTYYLNHSVDSQVVMKVCGPIGDLHVSYVMKHRSDEFTKRKNKRKYVTVFVGEGQDRHGEKRLEAESMEKTQTIRFYEGKIPEREQQHGGKDGGSVGLALLPPNRYMLTAACDLFVEMTGTERSERTLPAPVKTKRSSLTLNVGPFGEEPSSVMSGDDDNTSIVSTAPPDKMAFHSAGWHGCMG